MFIDHRLGENDPTLTNDEKLMQRLIAERTVCSHRSHHLKFFVDFLLENSTRKRKSIQS